MKYFKCPICGKINRFVLPEILLIGETNGTFGCLNCKTEFNIKINIDPYEWNEKYDNIIDDIFNGAYCKSS